MSLGTTIVMSDVSSALSSIVEHCSEVDWLLHNADVEATVSRFLRENVLARR